VEGGFLGGAAVKKPPVPLFNGKILLFNIIPHFGKISICEKESCRTVKWCSQSFEKAWGGFMLQFLVAFNHRACPAAAVKTPK
jgi:hypothetical protein